MNWETGVDMYTLIRIKQITNKNLLYKIIKLNLKKNKVYVYDYTFMTLWKRQN